MVIFPGDIVVVNDEQTHWADSPSPGLYVDRLLTSGWIGRVRPGERVFVIAVPGDHDDDSRWVLVMPMPGDGRFGWIERARLGESPCPDVVRWGQDGNLQEQR